MAEFFPPVLAILAGMAALYGAGGVTAECLLGMLDRLLMLAPESG